MLARIADPALRLTFTPKTVDLCADVLGLDPETVLFTVDGAPVTADLWSVCFTSAVSSTVFQVRSERTEEYSAYYEDYLNDDTYWDPFENYLLDKHGIDITGPVDWTAQDGQLLQETAQAALDQAVQTAVLLAHEKDYPLTDEQKAELEQLAAEATDYTGYLSIVGLTEDTLTDLVTSAQVMENLTASLIPQGDELTQALWDAGYFYGQYAVFYRGEYSSYSSDEEALAAAEDARSQLAAHLDDPEYVEFLLWKLSEDYAYSPQALDLAWLDEAGAEALSGLEPGQLSDVLVTDEAYVIVLAADPAQEDYLGELLATGPAGEQAEEWTQQAQVETADAYDALDLAALASAWESFYRELAL